uniref:Osiris 18 n=1 Tax=Bombyx mori TaxID=7091 RepID=A0A8R2RAC6_BOMMO|nr:uncharacterized protein LOC101740498 isoform X2 [Bombyx mori]
MMSPLVLLLAFVLVGDVRAIVELDCNDNATCIEQIPKQLIVNLRQKKAVKIFDLITIEPLATRQARSSQDLWTRFLENHAVSFDLLDYTFQITPREDNTNALNFEVFESRTAKDVSDQTSKKSSSKAEEDKEEDKSPKLVIKRKHKKKVMQVLIPMLFGMKSAGAVIFAFTVVAVLTIKAFIASKLALMVTVGMALKKLYDSYGVGLPETSNVLWKLANYFRILFGLPTQPMSYAQTMSMPMYAFPQTYNPVTMPTGQ